MAKIYQLLIMAVTTGMFVFAGCTTDDPRDRGSFADADRPRGLGEQCSDMEPCATGLTCLDGTCTPDAFAAACTPNPCAEGLCNARGETDIQTLCRCGGIPVSTASAAAGITGFLWDGATCVADAFPAWPGSVTPSTTCPAAELAPGVPDETTADCPVNDFTFCTADSGGDCLEWFVELNGSIDGQVFGGSTTGGPVLDLDQARCIREYIEGNDSGDSAGMELVITGTLADSLFPGTSSITIDVSRFDAVGGGTAIVWPQSNAPEPQSDAGFVDVTVTSTRGTTFTGAAIGGEFIVDSVSGPDSDEDKRIDDSEGAIGGEFYLGLPNGDFISGAFTVNCGDNVVLTSSTAR